jgi:hypothetical protein
VEDVISMRFAYFGDGEPPVATIGVGGEIRVTYGPAPPRLGVDDPNDSWGPGENCTFAIDAGRPVSRLRSLGAGTVALGAALLTDGPWCPDAEHAFRFDADLLRVRRVRVAARLQAAHPFRGPAGALFAHAGSAGDPSRFVPDEHIAFDVAPRNINVAR